MRRGTLRVRGRSLSGAQRRPAGARPAPRTDLDAEYDRSRRKGGVRVVLRGPGKVLHMGEKGFAGTGADFSHDSAVYRRPSRRVDALPCAHRGVCAHGSVSTNLDDSRRTAVFQRKPASAPSGHRSRMCVTTGRGASICEPPSHPSRSAPRARGSLRGTTGPDKRAAREGRARASATSGSPVGTRTYLSNVNVPFSHPSGDRVQKVGRKVRSRDEGTLTLGPAARSARPAPRRNQSSRRGLRLLRTGIVRRACWSPMRWRRRWFAVARLRTATGPKFGQ